MYLTIIFLQKVLNLSFRYLRSLDMLPKVKHTMIEVLYYIRREVFHNQTSTFEM